MDLQSTSASKQRELRIWRAAVFAIAVVAQLALPAIALRAQALEGQLCVGGDARSDNSTVQIHAKQCAHCKMDDCTELPPLRESDVPVARAAISASIFAVPKVDSITLRGAQPPPTGPPSR